MPKTLQDTRRQREIAVNGVSRPDIMQRVPVEATSKNRVIFI